MTKVVVIGHGGYGTMIKSSLEMLVGRPEGFFYIDFNINDDLLILQEKIRAVIKTIPNEAILFACDLTGGTPFREASLLTAQNQNYAVVGGLNTAGYAEISYNLELPPKELAQLGIEASKESMMIFAAE